jgi:hypothetical protein
MGDIRWDAPCPPPGLVFPIYRAVAGATIRLVALNEGAERTRVHFLPPGTGGPRGRTVPCVGKEHGCWCGHGPLRRQWYAYLGCWDPHVCRRVIAEITPEAYRLSSLDLSGEVLSVRGQRLRLYRRGASVHAPVRVEWDPAVESEIADLPDPIDVRSALRHIWGLTDGQDLKQG